jgi:hypothetical protein
VDETRFRPEIRCMTTGGRRKSLEMKSVGGSMSQRRFLRKEPGCGFNVRRTESNLIWLKGCFADDKQTCRDCVE